MNENKEGLIFTSRDELIFKIIVIGDPAVGKTSLLNNFSSKKFQIEYIPTVGVNIVKEPLTILDKNNKEINVFLLFWDVAGQPQFYMLHRPYFNGADGMILVYDITRSSSFSNVNNWYNSAVRYGLSGIPRILVGNKIDLSDERKIIQPMADHLSEKLTAPFFETSALKGDGVKIVFQKIAEMAYQSKLAD